MKNSRLYKFIYDNRITIIGVLIILTTHVINMLINHCGILGDKSYISGDNIAVILPSIQEFKRKLMEWDGSFYTWHCLGGMDFYFMFVSCLTNPLLFVLTFFKIEYLSVVIDIIVVILTILSFFSVRHYLTNREFGIRIDKNSVEVLLFCIPYALVPAFYNMSLYYTIVMPYIVMPFVILGLEKIIAGKGWGLYFGSLVITLISNYYIGAIGCVFIILYFFTLPHRSFGGLLRNAGNVLIISVFAVLTSAFNIIPQVFLSLSGGYGFSDFKGVGFYSNWLDVLDTLMFGKEMVNDGGIDKYWNCNLYMSMFIIVFTVYFFCGKRRDRIEKIKKATVLLVMLLSINGKVCNYVFHLFHYTHGLHNRQLMFIILYCIILACDAFVDLKKIDSKREKNIVTIITVFMCGFFILLYLYNDRSDVMPLVVSLLLILLYYGFIISKGILKKKVWRIGITCALCLEVCCNYLITYVPKVDPSCIYKLNDECSSLDQLDDDEYGRVSVEGFGEIDNYGLIIGCNTCEGFYNDTFVGYIKELGKLGVNVGDLDIDGNGYNSFLNCLLSRKYIVKYNEDGDDGIIQYTNDDAVMDGFKETYSDESVTLLENEFYTEPVIMSVNSLSDYKNSVDDGECRLAEQNSKLCEVLTGISDLITEENVDISIPRKTPNCDVTVDSNHLRIEKYKDYKNGEYDDEGAMIQIVYVAPEDGEYILSTFDNRNLGMYKKGEEVSVFLRIKSGYFDDSDCAKCDIIINRLDVDKMASVRSVLKDNQVDVSEFSSGRIKCDVYADKPRDVFTTIPYSMGWKAEVDGKTVPVNCTGQGFLSLNVDAGQHSIELKYSTKGVNAGVVVSLISLLIGIVICRYKHYKM